MNRKPNTVIERRSRNGVETVLLGRGHLTEASITVHVNGVSDLAGMLAEACEEVRALGATVLRQDVFGISAQHAAARGMLRQTFGEVDWPVTWLEEGASLGEKLTGTHLYAIGGTEVRRLREGDRVLGSVYSDGLAEYCHLAGVIAPDLTADRSRQTRAVLERFERVLALVGMTFGDVVRTWFYNDHILDWYDEFNAVRTQFFKERGVLNGLVPASTGIGGGNLDGAALVGEALAVRPLDRGASRVSI